MSAVALNLLSALLLSQSFHDDFEGLTLENTATPPGQWSFNQSFGNSSLAPRGVAAHRGDQGVRFFDTTTLAEDGTEARLTGIWGSRVPHFVGRAWVRTSAMTNDGEDFVMNINTDWGGGRFAFATLLFRVPGYTLSLESNDDNAARTLTELPAAMKLAPGTWHLVELSVSGMGTTSGCIRAAFDGVAGAEKCGLPLTQTKQPQAGVGLVWQAPRIATGFIDMDDVAFSDGELASTMTFSPLSLDAATGDCVELTATAASTWGGSAPWPFAEVVPVAGAFALFSDSACSKAADGLTLTRGATNAKVFVKPLSPGTQSVRVLPLSVLAGPLPEWNVSGAAISDAPLEQSCGCDAGGAGLLGALALLRAATGRRAARRCSTPPTTRRR